MVAAGGGAGRERLSQAETDKLWRDAPNKAMLVEADTLRKFRHRTDEALTKLLGSPAAPGRLADERIARGQLGGGDGHFAEAEDLFGAYETVVTQLKQLSTMLSDSIEGLSIAVHASQTGYDAIDEDVRRRLAALDRNTRRWAQDHPPAGTPKSSPSRGTEF